MSIFAKEIRFNNYPVSASYDPDKVYLPDLMYTSVGLSEDQNWVGPLPIGVARPMEQSTPVAMAYPMAIRKNDNIFWVFLAENSTAAANRRVFMYEYDRSIAEFNWKGFVTLTLATNQTVRGLRVARYLYTTGTVAASGLNVAGNGTTWLTDGQAVGARIGFGSTNPDQITEWFEINSVPSDVQISLNPPTGVTIPSGTAYVIDELRVALATTAATALSGGLYIAKGLSENTFSGVGTTIPAATTLDNRRAVYFLADNAIPTSQLTTTAGGLGMGDFTSWQSHSVYLLTAPSTTTPRIFHFNMRANLTPTNGRAMNALLVGTGLQTTVGTLSQTNNGRIAKLGHGPGSGSDCFYFVSTNRIYRTPLTSITSGSTTYVVDQMTEVPPGSTTTFPAASAFAAVEHLGSLDRLIVTSTGTSGARSYLTKYNTVGSQMDHIIFVDTKQQDQSSGQGAPHVSVTASPLSVWGEDGMVFVARNTTSTTTNQLYMTPLGADQLYSAVTGQYIIAPKISTPGCTAFRRVYVNYAASVGTGVLKMPTEPFIIDFRTTGIDDDSGSWSEVDAIGDLSAIGGADEIQFRFRFNVISGAGIPTRIYNLTVLYEAESDILPEFEWNLNDSNTSTGTIGFSQQALFSLTVPFLSIDYYRSDTSALVLTDNSIENNNGEFQWYSGSVWEPGLGPNTIGTRRRYVPSAGLPASVNVYPKIYLYNFI